MIKVYLDNNIIVDLEMGKKTIPFNENVTYYYSYAHLKELMEAKEKLEEIKERRLRFISTFTSGHFLQNENQFPWEPPMIVETVEDPFRLFEVCQSMEKYSSEELKSHQKALCTSNIKSWLQDNGLIDVKIQNNYSPPKIVSLYQEILNRYIQITSGDNRYAGFQSVFIFLEAIGYHFDKKNDEFHSNVSRSYDAEHAYFASKCDFFVSEDRGRRAKSNVAYCYWGNKTRAIGYDELMRVLRYKRYESSELLL